MLNTDKIDALFDELVPADGAADTVAGEIVRAISRIGYRYFNDGDHIGIGYGKETCNPAARYLLRNSSKEIREAVLRIWGIASDEVYEQQLEELVNIVVEYIEQHPELKEQRNYNDMLDYSVPEDFDDEDEEDYDYWEDDEEEW